MPTDEHLLGASLRIAWVPVVHEHQHQQTGVIGVRQGHVACAKSAAVIIVARDIQQYHNINRHPPQLSVVCDVSVVITTRTP